MNRTIVAFLSGVFVGMSSILWHLFYWAVIVALGAALVIQHYHH